MALPGQSSRVAVACVALALVLGCRSKQEAQQSAGGKAPPGERSEGAGVILPESGRWSRAAALAKLADEAAGVSAAVRLIRLAEARPLCVPEQLSPKIARRLRLVRLSETLWALGWSTAIDEQPLRAAVLISSAGAVELPVRGPEEEVSLLFVSADADVFPHLLITPLRVLIVTSSVRPAIVVKSLGGLRFALRREAGLPYVALIWRAAVKAQAGQPAPPETTELARYTWDPYELAFMGPVSDKLPDPPGGRFEIDLEQSRALVPVGGEIAAPDPVIEYEPPEDWEEDEPPR